jgi:hypothetical protein
VWGLRTRMGLTALLLYLFAKHAYKKGVGALQEDDGVIPLSIPEHHLDAIAPTLSRLILSDEDEDLKTLRSRSLLDRRSRAP